MAAPRDDRLVAELVYDGGGPVHIPPTLGNAEHQPIVGSELEQVAELAAFVSEALDDATAVHIHRALIERRLLLPYRHATFGVVVEAESPTQARAWAGTLFGLPDVTGAVVDSTVRVIANLRGMIRGFSPHSAVLETPVAAALAETALGLAPQFPWTETPVPSLVERWRAGVVNSIRRGKPWALLTPAYAHERYVTVYFQAAMGVLADVAGRVQEAAVARRTSEFDAGSLGWIVSPVLKDYLRFCESQNPEVYGALDQRIQEFATQSQRLYDDVVGHLESHSGSPGRARLAAAGFLGQSVRSEAIVTANVSEWQQLLRHYGDFRTPSDTRHLFIGKREGDVSVFSALMQSRYRESFLGAQLRASTDGLGRVLDAPPHWPR